MQANFTISQSDPEALLFATEWATIEGWNPGLDDAKTMLTADPNGFFLGRLDDQPIACASAVCYDKDFAFFGYYIVLPSYRGQGIGMQVTQKRLDYVGDRCVGLDGVVANERIYEKIGFKRDFISHRYEVNNLPHNNHCAELINPYQSHDFNALCSYDRQCFPSEREAFLQAWLNAEHANTFCAIDHGQFQGYVVIRRCQTGYKIGPLFADNCEIASALLSHAMHSVESGPVYIDVPSCNDEAQRLIHDLDAASQFACVRMYRNGLPTIDKSKIYGINSFELG